LGDAGGGEHDHGLVELIHGTVDVAQPAHDWRGRHRPDALIDRPVLTVGHTGDASQPRHRLLGEDVAGSTGHTGRPGAGHHLHRQDAVSAEDLSVDAGQDFFDGGGGGAVVVDVEVFGCG